MCSPLILSQKTPISYPVFNALRQTERDGVFEPIIRQETKFRYPFKRLLTFGYISHAYSCFLVVYVEFDILISV
jgi:hypothetical protein